MSQSQNRRQRSRKNQEESSNSSNSNGNAESPNPQIAQNGQNQNSITPIATKDETSENTVTTNAIANSNNNITPAASVHSTSNPASIRSTPSPVPSNLSSISNNTSTTKRAKSILTSESSEESESSDERTEGENSMDTEGEGEPLNPNEIELVFKPHPTEMTEDHQIMQALRDNSVRYLKTTENASVDHLNKYLTMRLTLDLGAKLPVGYHLLNFCIYVAPSPGQFVPLAGLQTLRQINDKFRKVNKPLEMYYSWKKT